MRIASGLVSPARIRSDFDTAVISRMPARARIGCIASVTGEFQPSITTSTFSAIISLARLTPTAGVLSSSLEISVILRPSKPPFSLICSIASLTALVTDWPSGPAPPLSGKMVPTLISCAIAGAAQSQQQGDRQFD